MALKYALLRALADGPLHGYAVRSAVTERIGAFWAASQGQIYATLERLTRDGLIDPVDSSTARSGAIRRHYAISPSGQRALREWLAAPGATDRNDGLGFDDWLAHLAVCEHWGDADFLRRTIDVQRQRCRILADALDQRGAASEEDLAIRAARHILLAELEWLEIVDHELSSDASRDGGPRIDH